MSEQKYNQISCWQKHQTWKHARAVMFEEIRLTDKQKNAIKRGHKILQGAWEFMPIGED